MKKGVIVEIKNNQKIILADNGRFYVASYKKGDIIGARVRIGINKKRIMAFTAGVIVATFSFLAGIEIVHYTKSGTPETLIRISSYPDDYSAELILNNRGNVLSVAPLSVAAVVVLSSIKYEFKSVETVTRDFLEVSAQCGYLDTSSEGLILVNSYNVDSAKIEKINSRVFKAIRSFAVNKGIKHVAIAGVPTRFSNLTNQIKTELPLTVASSIVEQSDSIRYTVLKEENQLPYEKAIKEVAKLNNSEIMNIIKLAHQEYFRLITDEEKELISEIKEDSIKRQKEKISNNSPTFLNKEQYSIWESSQGAKLEQQLDEDDYFKQLLPPPYVGNRLVINYQW